MIREATIDDLKPLAALYKELMVYHNLLDPKQYSIPDDETCEKKIQLYLEMDGYDGTRRMPKLICHDTNGIVDGYARYDVCNPYFDEEKIFGFIAIEQLIVSENVRRKGIGSKLVHELLNMARENYCEILSIKVHANNEIAREFYEKMGLVPTLINMEKRI